MPQRKTTDEDKRRVAAIWREKNREKRRAYKREWYARNREAEQERHRAYRQTEKGKTYDREYYERHKAEIIERIGAWRKEHPGKVKEYRDKFPEFVRDLVRTYKQSHPCVICGEDDYRVLQFHHREPRDKSFMLSQASARRRTLAPILAEIEKCDVLCGNCHARLHYDERNETSGLL